MEINELDAKEWENMANLWKQTADYYSTVLSKLVDAIIYLDTCRDLLGEYHDLLSESEGYYTEAEAQRKQELITKVKSAAKAVNDVGLRR